VSLEQVCASRSGGRVTVGHDRQKLTPAHLARMGIVPTMADDYLTAIYGPRSYKTGPDQPSHSERRGHTKRRATG